jgi:hypothetical protein
MFHLHFLFVLSAPDLPPQREDESDTFTTIETVPSTVTKQPLNQQPSRNVSQHIPQTKNDSVALVEKVLLHLAHCLYCLV